jgi:hypothetical protein
MVDFHHGVVSQSLLMKLQLNISHAMTLIMMQWLAFHMSMQGHMIFIILPKRL